MMNPESETPYAIYLLAIRGTLKSPTLEAARRIHNETAGAPANVAAAQSLGDLSHMVHVPVDRPESGPSEFLILDLWNSMEGLNKFFANPQVQEQAGRIFSARDPVVWAPAEKFTSYHVPSPFGKNERFVAIARGTVSPRDDARARHNKIVADQINKARMAGNMSHQAFFRLAQPRSPEASEFLAMDVWMSAAGMDQHYQDQDLVRGFHDLFSSSASTSTWVHPPGDWVEW
jgi:quinol monooxygenase YgiN